MFLANLRTSELPFGQTVDLAKKYSNFRSSDIPTGSPKILHISHCAQKEKIHIIPHKSQMNKTHDDSSANFKHFISEGSKRCDNVVCSLANFYTAKDIWIIWSYNSRHVNTCCALLGYSHRLLPPPGILKKFPNWTQSFSSCVRKKFQTIKCLWIVKWTLLQLVNL